jgi:hypothetical protein
MAAPVRGWGRRQSLARSGHVRETTRQRVQAARRVGVETCPRFLLDSTNIVPHQVPELAAEEAAHQAECARALRAS